jgi:hypothetical protein
MKRLPALLFGLAIIATTASSSITPAFALGGCGFNYHRNWAGRCVWGGQNQDWCLRHTGHTAVRGPHGTWVCIR